MGQDKFKYFAFISYNSHDIGWGRRLQRKLEHFRMPATLCSEYGWERSPLRPVFFAPTDIQPGELSEELQQRLIASRNLIVICSPHSAQSVWVGREIEFFHHLGRTKQIHFFIVDGVPHSGDPQTECFHPIIDALGLPEILGANIHERVYRWPWLNKERAYVQLISKLLGVEFDAIWQRHRRLLIQKVVIWSIAVLFVLAAFLGLWLTNQPLDVEVRLNEASIHNDNLPPLQDAIVTIALDNEFKTDTIRSIDRSTVFTNIPHRFLNKKVHATVESKYHQPIDTVILLTGSINLDIYRDPTIFGNVHFQLWNPDEEVAAPSTEVIIDGHPSISDTGGYVNLNIPLSEQKTAYPISSSIPLVDTLIMLPCGPDDVIRFK